VVVVVVWWWWWCGGFFTDYNTTLGLCWVALGCGNRAVLGCPRLWQ
jgi:hypothetical protein